MKTLTKLLLFFLLSCNIAFGQAIKVDSDNRVGINGEPKTAYNCTVNGTFYATKAYIGNHYGAFKLDLNGCMYIRGYIFKPLYGSGCLKIVGATDAATHIGIGGGWQSNSVLNLTSSSGSILALNVNGPSEFSETPNFDSDKKLKKDIKELEKTEILEKALAVSPKKYKYKTREELEEMHNAGQVHFYLDTIVEFDNITGKEIKSTKIMVPNYSKGEHYGVLADELEEIFPELVKTDSVTLLKSVDYISMVPILFEALQATNERIDELERALELTKKEKDKE